MQNPVGVVITRVIGAIVLLFSILFIAAALWFYTSTSRFVKNAIRVPGVVTSLVADSGGSSNSTFSARYTFVDPEGNEHQSVSGISSRPAAYSVGEKVTVLFEPGKPEKAELDSFWELWLGTVICSIVAVPPLMVGLVLIFVIPFFIRRPTSKKPPPIP